LLIPHSESLGSYTSVCGLQPGRRSMLRHLLLPLSRTLTSTSKVRCTVRWHSSRRAQPHGLNHLKTSIFVILTLSATCLISWTVGSLLFLSSWAILQGPVNYAKHLLSAPRLPFTAAYFGSIMLTLFFSIRVRLSRLHPP